MRDVVKVYATAAGEFTLKGINMQVGVGEFVGVSVNRVLGNQRCST